MKELSIEEKAKAYDGLIERLKDLKFAYRFSPLSDTIEEKFPELKESEDERIRKWIIDDIRYNMNNETLENSEYKKQAQKAITWLEKQGGKIEPIDVLNFNTKFERRISHLIAGIINKEYEYTEDFVKWVSNALLNCAKNEFEEQGEQKSLDDVVKEITKNKETATSFLKSCGIMNANGELADEYKIEQDEQNTTKDYSTLEITDIVRQALQECESFSNIRADVYAARVGATVEDLIKKQGEQNSDWSEEDECRIIAICTYLQDYARLSGSELRTIRINEYCGWLKSIKNRVQPKQEWSEEEQQIIKDAASFILSCVNTAETKKEEERLEELADKLQDLRPKNRWKPSDEQMIALSDINITGCISYAGQGQELINLYQELKKLK